MFTFNAIHKKRSSSICKEGQIFNPSSDHVDSRGCVDSKFILSDVRRVTNAARPFSGFQLKSEVNESNDRSSVIGVL